MLYNVIMIGQGQISSSKQCTSQGPRGIQCQLQINHEGSHESLLFTWDEKKDPKGVDKK